MRKVYPKATISTPVTLAVAADMGGQNATQGIVENLGQTEYRLTLTLNGTSSHPRVLWPGARYRLPCHCSSLTITPTQGEATYQVEVMT